MFLSVNVENHGLIFLNAGFKSGRSYRYWDEETRDIDFEGLCDDLRSAPKNAVIILHSCAHNPTGCDPTQEQWEIIANICQVIYSYLLKCTLNIKLSVKVKLCH